MLKKIKTRKFFFTSFFIVAILLGLLVTNLTFSENNELNNNQERVCREKNNNERDCTVCSSGIARVTNGQLQVEWENDHIDMIETDQSNKEWELQVSGGDFVIQEDDTSLENRMIINAGGDVEIQENLDVGGGISAGNLLAVDNPTKIRNFYLKFRYFEGTLSEMSQLVKTGLKGIVDVSLSLSFSEKGGNWFRKISQKEEVTVDFNNNGEVRINITEAGKYLNSKYRLLVHYGEWKEKLLKPSWYREGKANPEAETGEE